MACKFLFYLFERPLVFFHIISFINPSSDNSRARSHTMMCPPAPPSTNPVAGPSLVTKTWTADRSRAVPIP
jgi:hypothetical protein